MPVKYIIDTLMAKRWRYHSGAGWSVVKHRGGNAYATRDPAENP